MGRQRITFWHDVINCCQSLQNVHWFFTLWPPLIFVFFDSTFIQKKAKSCAMKVWGMNRWQCSNLLNQKQQQQQQQLSLELNKQNQWQTRKFVIFSSFRSRPAKIENMSLIPVKPFNKKDTTPNVEFNLNWWQGRIMTTSFYWINHQVSNCVFLRGQIVLKVPKQIDFW